VVSRLASRGVSCEAHVSAEPSSTKESAWLSGPDEDARRAGCAEAASCEGAKAANADGGLEIGVARASGGFGAGDRLRRPAEFECVRRCGQRRVSPEFLVVVAKAQGQAQSQALGQRLGIAVSRKVAGAVGRNRIKRCVREWFRTERGKLPLGIDIVVIARRGAVRLSGREIVLLLTRLLQSA
jgi:ribonuclease P protein component